MHLFVIGMKLYLMVGMKKGKVMKVVITSMRNESNYIVEWVAWNLMLGFDKCIIFTNNNNDDSLEILSRLKRLGVIDFFELNPPEGKKPQMYALSKGLEWAHVNKPSWIFCIDSDEFLVLKNDRNIDDYISRFDDEVDAIAINWRIFGSSGIEHKGLGLTPERFVMSAKSSYIEHRQFKSLFRYKESLTRFHHKAFYDDDVNYIYSDGTKLKEEAKKPGFNIKYNNYINFDYAQLNHYTIRSLSEFREKMRRGNGLDEVGVENKRNENYLLCFDKNSIFDNSALNFLESYIKVFNDLNKRIDMLS